MPPPPAAVRQAPAQHPDEGSLHLSTKLRKYPETSTCGNAVWTGIFLALTKSGAGKHHRLVRMHTLGLLGARVACDAFSKECSRRQRLFVKLRGNTATRAVCTSANANTQKHFYMQRVTMPSEHHIRSYVPELNPPLPVRQDRVHPAAY